MTDPSGTTNYSSYDNRDRLKTKATPEGTLSYTYDALNRLASAKDNRVAAQGGSSTPNNLCSSSKTSGLSSKNM